MPFEEFRNRLRAAGLRGAVPWIVVTSAAVLILQQIIGHILGPVFGLVPAAVWQRHWLWQPFTYLFLHGSLFHCLFNMLILWTCGRELESRWGSVDFLKYFFICGIGSALCVLFLTPHSTTPTFGSSGAVFGVLVAFAMVLPDAMMIVFIFPVKAWQAAALFAFIEFFLALDGGGAGVARFAHLSGMLTGFIYLRYGWQWSAIAGHPFSDALIWVKGCFKTKPRAPVEFHEVTDELVTQVDTILDKILKKGVESLTTEEKKIMDRYARMKK